MGFSRKNQTDKAKLHPRKFRKIVLDLLEIPRPKTKSHGSSTLFFPRNPWKFHFVLKWTLEIPYPISLIPLEIPYSISSSNPPPVWFFSGIANLHMKIKPSWLYYKIMKVFLLKTFVVEWFQKLCNIQLSLCWLWPRVLIYYLKS